MELRIKREVFEDTTKATRQKLMQDVSWQEIRSQQNSAMMTTGAKTVGRLDDLDGDELHFGGVEFPPLIFRI